MKVIFTVAIALVSLSAYAQVDLTAPTSSTSTLAPASSKAAPVTTIGTSTASTEVKPAANVRWSGSLILQGEATNQAIQAGIGNQNVATENYAGVGYKITQDTTLGLRQYFGYDTNPAQANSVSQMWSVLTVGTKFSGFAGSDDIAPLFWYYIPVQKAAQNALDTDDTVSHGGILRIDAEVAWKLDPKWTVSYYFNPRQSLISDINYTNRAGEAKHAFAQTTLIHYGYLYYNVSDAIQPYGYIGMDSRWSTHDLKSIKDHALIGVGAIFMAFNNKVIINPEIYNETPLKDNYQFSSSQTLLQSDNTNYLLTAGVMF